MFARIAKAPETPWPADSPAAAWPESAPAADPSAVLDASIINGIRELQIDGEDDLLGELIDIFLRDVPPRLHELRSGLERGDATVVRSIAHALKGSSASLGACRLSALCAAVEAAARAGNLGGLGDCSTALAGEFEAARQALEIERRK